MIAFVHFTRTSNIGDLMSGPYRYFDFSSAQVFDFRDEIPACETVIYGGGALINGLLARKPHLAVKAQKRIAWGIGSTRHGHTTSGTLPDGFDLIGSRDISCENYAPCTSCMSELFNRSMNPEHELVVYLNNDPRIPRPSGIEGLPAAGNWIIGGSNPDAYFAKIIAHLASGETVLTNSYHGAFWATLLRRKVVVAPAYSSKLQNFKYAPIRSSADGWRTSIRKAISYPEALDQSRMATLAFAERVRELTGN